MKTLRLLHAFLLLSSFSLTAQEDTLKDAYEEPAFRPGGEFYAGGFISPDLSWSIIPRTNSGFPVIKEYNPSYDLPKFSVTVGVEGMYQINQHLALTLGVQYSGKGGKTDEILYEPNAVAGEPVSMYYVYDYRYIDIPLRLDVYLTRGKVSPFITAGISTNIFINQRTNVFGIDANNNDVEMSYSNTSGFAAICPQLQAGMGLDIAIRNSRLRFFPIYRLALSDTPLSDTYAYSTGTVKGKLYSVGLGISYFIRF
jgi:hypothetical protein